LLIVHPGYAQQESSKTKKTLDDWIFLQNEFIRVGLLRSHGGAVAHLSNRDSEFNFLNHYDHGRLVQQSYYGDEDDSRWGKKPWRYNPVQGGDYQGRAGTIVEFRASETTAYCKSLPRHWASGLLLDECLMEQWVELDGPVVRLRYSFEYRGKESHAARHQETPAVFVSPKLPTLVTYTGKQPWTGDATSRSTPGWPNEYLSITENWAAYVGEDGLGVGVFVPGASEATCYRFQGGSGSSCSYIAPLKTFALTPGMKYSYTAYLTLGSDETIRSRFESLRNAKPPK
jgi:hypothetical protein